jgi:endonuclease YncB( thermonuclease family)
VNTILNALARSLASAISSRRWGRALVAIIILAAAGIGVWPQLERQAGAVAGNGRPAADAAQAGSVPANGFLLEGKVVRVADGDTFTLLVRGRQERIRMASIDAPEVTKNPDQPGQPYAQASRDALAGLIAGKTLSLRCFERDRYDRNICDVPLAEGGTANRRQVEAGMAWANLEKRGRFMRDEALPDLERQARKQRAGLWRDRDPVQPWVWRYQCWQKHQC